MWRTAIIIVALCGALAWFFTGQAPQRGGTLRIVPAAGFPEERQADLGRAVARILPHCPGFARFGGHVRFTDFAATETSGGRNARMSFSVPEGAAVPAAWGPYPDLCVYELAEDILRISGESCQALCLGKRPDAARDALTVDLNPKPRNSSTEP